MSNGQAKKGGQEGVNGYFYKGGQFLPSTQAEPGTFKSTAKKSKVRKVEIEPYVWVLPEEGQVSLYRAMGPGVLTGKENGAWVLVASDVTWGYYFDHDADKIAAAKAQYQAYCDRFNAGERWL